MAYPKTDEFLNQCLTAVSFDKNAGEFMEARTNGNHSWLEPAGRTTKYGRCLTIGNYEILAHHLVWRIIHKEWPNYHVKHVNQDVFDNRPENLHAPGKAKYDKKKSTLTSFLKTIGVSDRQMHVMIIENARKNLGERAAIDLELRFSFITKDEHAEALNQ
jgi:hypothetical protein